MQIGAILLPHGTGEQIKSAMLSNGYYVSEGGMAQLWVRADGNTNNGILSSAIGQTDSPLEELSAQASREHLPPEVKARMKSLCNDIYMPMERRPRYAN